MEPAGSSLFSQSSTDEELEVKETGDMITNTKGAGYEHELQIMDIQMQINKQINMEFDARYDYIVMYSLNRDDKVLHGFPKLFEKKMGPRYEADGTVKERESVVGF